MSGEPKTLTLEEALVLITRDTQYSLVAMPDEDSDEPVALSWVLLGAFDDFGPFTSWVQAAEYALGVPVVARDETNELRAALRTLVADLEALMEESHLSLYDGDGALVDTSWGKVLQGGKDEYLSNWRDAKRLAGEENER